jgi:TonB family protein
MSAILFAAMRRMGAKTAMTKTDGADETVGGAGVRGSDRVGSGGCAAGCGGGTDAEVSAASLLVVDSTGAPLRIAIVRPLGYGLDANAVEAMRRWRFTPGIRGGEPVATGVTMEQEFTFVRAPRH